MPKTKELKEKIRSLEYDLKFIKDASSRGIPYQVVGSSF